MGISKNALIMNPVIFRVENMLCVKFATKNIDSKSYSWYKDNILIGCSASILISEEDRGHQFKCVIEASNKISSTSATSDVYNVPYNFTSLVSPIFPYESSVSNHENTQVKTDWEIAAEDARTEIREWEKDTLLCAWGDQIQPTTLTIDKAHEEIRLPGIRSEYVPKSNTYHKKFTMIAFIGFIASIVGLWGPVTFIAIIALFVSFMYHASKWRSININNKANKSKSTNYVIKNHKKVAIDNDPNFGLNVGTNDAKVTHNYGALKPRLDRLEKSERSPVEILEIKNQKGKIVWSGPSQNCPSKYQVLTNKTNLSNSAKKAFSDAYSKAKHEENSKNPLLTFNWYEAETQHNLDHSKLMTELYSMGINKELDDSVSI